ncbi:MAG: hypothetical protein IKI39_07110 [Oscillospiraceae bacterium]|nr:hypothetical protein [Oscillospiraceae bacterium]
MGVYINMEMPKEGFVEILIRDDGTVQQTGQSYRIDGTDYYTPYVGEMPAIYKAVPVPPHGDLIDRDEIPYKKIMLDDDDEFYYGVTQPYIDRMPAVIEAEEGGT